jgi:Xaa-Pro dipeptidase
MTIAQTEYAARLSRVRGAMADAGLDALLVYSWKRGQVHYVSGYIPNYLANVAMVVVPQDRDPTLFIRFPFDLDRARAMCWFDDVRASGDVGALGRDATARLRELGLDQGRIGLVTGDGVMDELPYTLFQGLKDELPAATFSDARALMMDIRLTKSAAEFELLKGSAAVADAAIAAGEEALAPGVNEYQVVATVEAAARAAGGENYLVAIAGEGSRELIGPPEDKPIKPGAVVILEIAVRVRGYWTQVARAFVAGQPTSEQRAIYQAVYGAYRAAADAARPGTTLEAVDGAARAALSAAGYADYIEHDTGHGIGLDMPEPPRVEAGAEAPIQAGMALVLHPAVRVPGVGGAFVGGTVLISEDGPLPIHTIPEGEQ